MLWVLKEPSQWEGSFERPKHIVLLIGKKMITFYTQKKFAYLGLWSFDLCLALFYLTSHSEPDVTQIVLAKW